MKKVCDRCGVVRESALVHDVPCYVEGCDGTVTDAVSDALIEAIAVLVPHANSDPHPAEVSEPVDTPVEERETVTVIHSGKNAIARRETTGDAQRILSFIHNRAVDLDKLGAKSSGDLLRALCIALRDEFLI